MEYDSLIKALGSHIGIDLQPDEEGVCVLGVDDTMRVTIQYIDQIKMVSVFANVGEPPPQGLEKLLTVMLEANHLFRGTAGATLSRDPDTGAFCLCECLALDALDDERFINRLEGFVNTLEAWQKILIDYRPELTAAQETFPASGFPTLGSSAGFAV